MEFTEEYQQELLWKLTDRKMMKSLAPLLHPEAFSMSLQPIVEKMLQEWRRGRVFTQGQLKQVCAKEEVKLPRGPASDNTTFDVEEVRNFSRYRAVRQSLVHANALNEQGDYAGAVGAVSTCLETLPTENKIGIDLFVDPPSTEARKSLVATGVGTLDEALGGGIAAGELSVIMAPTGGGKTAWLVWIAIQAIRARKRVHYVTLEVPDYEIQHRALRCFLQKPHKRITRSMWAKATKGLKKKRLFQIVEYSPQSVTVDRLASEMSSDRDVLIIDYADNLAAQGLNTSTYEALGRIYESLKALSMSRRIPIWTASQVNRGAYKEEVETIGVAFVADSIRKMQSADQVLSFKLNHATAKRPTGVFFLAKNRHGPAFQKIKVTVDWPISRFERGEWG